MKRKHLTGAYVSAVAILLSCVGAISVGFATWVISQGDISTASGDINADKVDTNINGLTITPSCFTLGHYHYETVSSSSVTHSTTGTLSYEISINKSLLDKAIIPNNLLSLSFTLTFADSTGNNMAIFKDSYLNDITYSHGGLSEQYALSSPYTSVSVSIEEDVSGNENEPISGTLSFTFTQQLVARYGVAMKGGTFYLNVEAN